MIFRRVTALFAAVFFVALFAAGTAPAADPAAVGKPSPALWRVRNGASTVYLFGSLHILPKDYAWTTPEIDAAMTASERFVFEVPIDEAALAEEKKFIVENGLYGRGQSLRHYLSQEEYRRYSVTMRMAGLKPREFERYRPWLASVMLGLAYLHRQDFTALAGADETILAFAQARGKNVEYLETPTEQMALIMHGDQRTQMKALKSLIGGLSRSRLQETLLRETWASGDAAKFSAIIDGYFEDRPELRESLIDRRNRNWISTMKPYLESGGTTLVTVGVAHIGGEMGLLALLCGANYDVERVAANGAPAAKFCGPKA